MASPAVEEARLREQIAAEREQLAASVQGLRRQVGETVDVRARLGSKLSLAVAASAAAGFFLGGGVGATVRLLVRRGREGHERAHVGRMSVVER
jgi:hypothetical protein